MTEPTDVATGTTNSQSDSQVTLKCGCEHMWSWAQEFTYLRLCEKQNKAFVLIESYAARARRIAATYARFYLEIEKHGDPKKKGRYYWMALGAFASKTVACTLELYRMQAMSMAVGTVKEGLGKGNFWLFMDIAGWHWMYSAHPDCFEMCCDLRDSRKYVNAVKQQVEKLPWSAESLPKIKFLKKTNEIKSGFSLVKDIENSSQKNRPSKQFKHLMDIAQHEQFNVLQQLIYNDEDFANWIERQRGEHWWQKPVSWVSPNLQLSFSSECETDDAAFKSVAPDDTKLEDYDSRMKWIQTAAKVFHGLMQARASTMERELTIIAAWVAVK